MSDRAYIDPPTVVGHRPSRWPPAPSGTDPRHAIPPGALRLKPEAAPWPAAPRQAEPPRPEGGLRDTRPVDDRRPEPAPRRPETQRGTPQQQGSRSTGSAGARFAMTGFPAANFAAASFRPVEAARRDPDDPPAPASVASPHVATQGAADSLTSAATPLLSLVALLRDTPDFAGVAQLRSEVIYHIHQFDETAARNGAGPEEIRTARYILCSLIDEAVMTTSWGSASDWSTNSLLNRFHNETWGGEKVFAILSQLKADPHKNIALLRLIDLVLLLGFEGMHRVLEDGRERVADLSSEVGRLVGQNLPPVPAPLSGDCRGVNAEGTLRSYFPLWIVFAAAGFLLVVLYSYQRYRLMTGVAPVVEQMQAIGAGFAADGRRP